MTPLDFIASLEHGEAKAAALTVFNLMSPKWTEITDDPATLPETGRLIVIRIKKTEFLGARLIVPDKNGCLWVCTNTDLRWDRKAQIVVVVDGVPVLNQPTHWRPIG